MKFDALMNKYSSQVKVENVGFYPYTSGEHDTAIIELIVPTDMLTEYARLRGLTEKMSNCTKLWKDVLLPEISANIAKYNDCGHASVLDVLPYLKRRVEVSYQKLNDQGKVKLTIIELD